VRRTVVLLLILAACSDEGSGPLDLGGERAATDGHNSDLSAPDLGPPAGWSKVTPQGGVPIRRTAHLMTYDPDGQRVLLVGGQPGNSPVPLGDLWSWDGVSWTEISPASGPALPPRKNFGLAYDRARKRLVVFGGVYGGLQVTPTYLDDTWEWDGKTWIDRTPASGSPSPRAGHGMAYDAARQRVVMFGGGADSAALDDTWEWDGQSWEQKTTSTRPAPRYNTRMVYDEAGQRVVLFGGQAGKNHGDLWSWDGTSWTELWPSSNEPLGRGFFDLAYDSKRQRVVLYGGTTTYPPNIATENIFADHWEWDDKAWTRIGDGDGPGKRSAQAMTYDVHRGCLVLFGGTATGALYLDDTWEHR
jgi:hypothetical protein